MSRSDLAWIVALGAAAGLQARALRRGDVRTLCQIIRRVFRTDTAAGRAAFTLAWLAFARWYGRHVLEGQP